MELILYIVMGIIIVAIEGWLLGKARTTAAMQLEKPNALQNFSKLEKELFGYKATATAQFQTVNENLNVRLIEFDYL